MSERDRSASRVRIAGKFFRLGDAKWHLKGFTYGPFAPNGAGEFLPGPSVVAQDFACVRKLGATAIRVYHPPPKWLLDVALEHDLRVLIDVPWEKHRCFFEDWVSQQEARLRIRRTAEELGHHPAVFAISVANEFPNDIVRFYGHRRLSRFLEELLDSVHQAAPECLATFANFPTTEFLIPKNQDFFCFNVYLHDPETLGRYLDRLQHIAGSAPLVLGEYGIDSLREGEHEQAALLQEHVEQSFRHGLAGSIIFSYTDDWFTGGHQIEDWAFGVTRRDRSLKESAYRLQSAWQRESAPSQSESLPSVSVVVCSYNAAATLEECLDSLMRLNYPDYEVILVDDGSTDRTPEIAAQFPQVVTIRQPNRGLSVARNVGAQRARGEIVAYTDSDCVADEDWLLHLVRSMQDQQVAAIGGPNISPPSDNWTAKCVSASPGNPSHVMLDDRHAEHVPGCNMAFDREVLLGLGGFDPQFRQAGDDVDMCWRFLDAGFQIGYASGAMVWHHRRCTVSAYFKQQRGYGRAEAMVHFKHPQKFSRLGYPRFHGVIYGDGAVGLPVLPPRIYHGQFGSALFQTIYRTNEYGPHVWITSFEWHVLTAFLLVLSCLWPGLAAVAMTMWAGTLAFALRSAWQAPLPPSAPWWSRPLVAFLHVAQPIVRGWSRHRDRIRNQVLPPMEPVPSEAAQVVKRISATEYDLYWQSQGGRGREHLLDALLNEGRRTGWKGDFEGGWVEWDAELVGTPWHRIVLRTATEELGWPKRFTRVRWSVLPTGFTRVAVAANTLWGLFAVGSGSRWGMVAGLLTSLLFLSRLLLSRRRCLKATAALVGMAALRAELEPVDVQPEAVPTSEPEIAAEPEVSVA